MTKFTFGRTAGAAIVALALAIVNLLSVGTALAQSQPEPSSSAVPSGSAVSSSSAVSSKNNEKREVDLELEEVPGATSYEIELTSKLSSKTLTFKMREAHWHATIRPGDYNLRMRAYDERGVPGDWSEATPFSIKLSSPSGLSPILNTEIKTKEEYKYETEFRWSPIPGTAKYRVDVTPIDATGGKGAIVSDTFKTTQGKINLPVANQYSWTVVPISTSGVEGDAQDQPNLFKLVGREIERPEVEHPEDIYVQILKWERPKFADAFNFVLNHRTSDGKWERISGAKDFKDTSLDFSTKYPGGHYRFVIQATGRLRENSKATAVEFDVYAGDRSPEAIEEAKLRQSLEKPTPWYFVASYYLSSIRYTGRNPEAGRVLSYNVPGGTGRLGLGYISRVTDRGGLGIIDLSGYTIDNKFVTWASAEGHYIRRFTWGRNMLRPSVGLYYKEYKEAVNTSLNATTYKQQDVAVLGPHVGFDFWRPFTSKFGMQLNARLYYDAFKVKTPNGLPLVPEPSYLFGFMGSYKIKPNITGFMGWAHRYDHVAYRSTPSNGNLFQSIAKPTDVQDIQIQGEFFNLLLEWSF